MPTRCHMAYVGTPADQIDEMRNSPFWPSLGSVAPTLAYDHAGILGHDASVPVERVARVHVPTLVMHGGASYPFIGDTARSLSQAIPAAELRTVQGQSQSVDLTVLSSVLVEFFGTD